MATKSFLSSEEFEEGRRRFLAPVTDLSSFQRECCFWLSERLTRRLSELPGWSEAGAIRLGSWARGELCPCSDVDLLFVGEEAAAASVMAEAQRRGLKIRARLPEDPKDWTVGVLPFDILALLSAQAFEPTVASLLLDQQSQILRQDQVVKKKILSAIQKERKERQRRHDSISNYLEPNLKFGPGGLRDIEQALVTRSLFPEIFEVLDGYPFAALEELKAFLLSVRILSHWAGAGDILSATVQHELFADLGYENHKDMMAAVQEAFDRSSFYADWTAAQAKLGAKLRANRTSVTKPRLALKALLDSPSVIVQYEVRKRRKEILRPLSPVEKGALLTKIMCRERAEDFWIRLQRSRFLDECLPELKRVRSLVQHDHYHRFPVGTHLIQALREVSRAQARPSRLGRLKPVALQLSASDFRLLRWTALFHDLAKGQAGDHSTGGAKIVRECFVRWKLSGKDAEEVAWLVENHLLLSTAAFRQNPNQPATWQRLFERGVAGERLKRLMIFTAIDILATNPQAWTPWKSVLLFDLYKNMTSPSASNFRKLLELNRRRGFDIPEDLLKELDPLLIEGVGPLNLLKDLVAVRSAAREMSLKDLPPLIVSGRRGQTWVRFHRREDRFGVFLEFVQRLYQAGVQVRAASVMTVRDGGVYDWFCVRTRKPKAVLSARLTTPSLAVPERRSGLFSDVEVMSKDESEWVFSFRARDQKGLLLAAARALFERNLSVRWARVHTWGQQIDDVISVEPRGDLQSHLEALRSELVT